MPVIGHAFVGLATAACSGPRARPLFGTTLWAPVVVGLAYLPDLVSQPLVLCGFPRTRVVTHSAVFGVLASLVTAALLAKFFRVSYGRAYVVSLLSILIHVAFDVLQATDQQPWWPLAIHGSWLEESLIPGGLHWEALWFGGAFVAIMVIRWGVRRMRAVPATLPGAAARSSFRTVWTNHVVVGSILLAATVMSYVKGIHARELHIIKDHLAAREFSQVLLLVDHATRWAPSNTPGRLDYYAAEAHLGMGNRVLAEKFYLKAYRTDPSDFWTVADLALFLASSDEPAEVRRQRAAPLVERLRREFADHKDQPRFVAKIERKLAQPSP